VYGVLLAMMWCLSVSLSRLYLGVHSVLVRIVHCYDTMVNVVFVGYHWWNVIVCASSDVQCLLYGGLR